MWTTSYECGEDNGFYVSAHDLFQYERCKSESKKERKYHVQNEQLIKEEEIWFQSELSKQDLKNINHQWMIRMMF